MHGPDVAQRRQRAFVVGLLLLPLVADGDGPVLREDENVPFVIGVGFGVAIAVAVAVAVAVAANGRGGGERERRFDSIRFDSIYVCLPYAHVAT